MLQLCAQCLPGPSGLLDGWVAGPGPDAGACAENVLLLRAVYGVSCYERTFLDIDNRGPTASPQQDLLRLSSRGIGDIAELGAPRRQRYAWLRCLGFLRPAGLFPRLATASLREMSATGIEKDKVSGQVPFERLLLQDEILFE